MPDITLLHGSQKVIEVPSLLFSNDHNDYGRGFYCTDSEEMAKEWACKKGTDGFVNRYLLESDGLSVLNLSDGNYSVLNWIAILLKYRTFSLNSRMEIEAKEYLIRNFYIEKSNYDLIIGYRADDSYFRFAESFLQNTLPLRSLARALTLGKLGLQTVLVSEKAFSQLRFSSATPVDGSEWYPRFLRRDTEARRTYKKEASVAESIKGDLFMLDILREEIGYDDPRVQRIISG